MENLEMNQDVLDRQIDQDKIDAEARAQRQREDEAFEEKEQQIQEATAAKSKGSPVGEAFNAIAGGVAGAAEDLWTLPERVYDMASGEMAEQGADYRPDSAFLDEDSFETKTVWGSILKNVVNVGTMFIPVGGLARGLGLGAKIAGAASKGNKVAKIVNNPLAKGALKGAAVDTILQSSQEENASAMLRDTFGWIDTPLATKDTDHPAMKTLKNVVEGMGVGAIMDGVFFMVKGAGGAADVAKRNDNIKAQTVDMAKKADPEAEFDAYRDKAVADTSQGNPTSSANPADVSRQLDNIDQRMDGEYGSTDSPITVRQADRMATASGESPKVIRELVEKYMDDPQVKKELAAVKSGQKSLSDIKASGVSRFKEMAGNSRDLEELDVEAMLRDAPKDRIAGVEIATPENVLVYDMLTGGLAKQVRDLGIAARELKNHADITANASVADQLKTKLTTLMVATKRARYMSGINLKRYDITAGNATPAKLKKELKSIEDSTREQIETMFSMFGEDPNSELFEGVLEAMSMSNSIRSLKDFDSFMSAKLRGGEFDGKKFNSITVKELGNVMVHSILSGPKTPVRAALGTSIAGTTRMLSQSLGAMLRLPFTGDVATAKASAASVGAMVGAIPEAFKVFRTKLNSYWSGELATAATRYAEFDLRDDNWRAFGEWANTRGSEADKAAYNIANMARSINDSSFFTYSTKLMAATDDAWRVIMARARAKEQAVRFVLDNKKNGMTLSAADARAAEDGFYKGLLNDAGDVDIESDTFLKSMVQEATLTQNLEGFSKGLEDAFNRSPWIKPFFLFARTGVNGLALTAKNTPLVNLVLEKQRAILTGNAENLPKLAKYGINTMEELANEKALMAGRQAIGTAVVFMGSQMWMNGNLRGNGPADRRMRQVWTDAGWRRSEIKLGDVWVNFDSLEPWSQTLNLIADIGDASQLMGPEWTENKLKTLAAILADGASSKSYLQGLQQLVDLASGEPYQFQKILGNLANNTVPLAGLRNEIGKIINPQQRELSASIFDAVRNRNLLTESMAGDNALPIKYDILTGKPIRDWDTPTRFWNAFSPVNLNFDDGPGRQLLFNSNYDLRTSVMSAPDGSLNLRDLPRIRSLYQREIGLQNLEEKLNRLSMRKDVKKSVAQMQADIDAGDTMKDPGRSYVHNKLIKNMFRTAQIRAWAKVKQMPEVQELIEEQQALKARENRSAALSRQVQPIIELPSK